LGQVAEFWKRHSTRKFAQPLESTITKQRTSSVVGLNLLVWLIAIGGWLLVRFSRGSLLYLQVAIIAVVIISVLIAIGYGTLKKNKWGVNFDPVFCPRCGKPVGHLRVPKTPQQALWGGGTCSACGTEIDKWGREIPSPSGSQNAHDCSVQKL